MNPKSPSNSNNGNSSKNNNPTGGNPGDRENGTSPQGPEGILASFPNDRFYFEIPFVASMFRCSRRHVFRLIDSGQLPNCVDISMPDSSRKLLRIPRSSIEAYLKRNNF